MILYLFIAFILGGIIGFSSYWSSKRLSGGRIIYYIPRTREGDYSVSSKMPVFWFLSRKKINEVAGERKRLKRFLWEVFFGLIGVACVYLYGLSAKAVFIFISFTLFGIFYRIENSDYSIPYPILIIYITNIIYYYLTGNIGIILSTLSVIVFIASMFHHFPLQIRRILIGVSMLMVVAGSYSILAYVMLNLIVLLFRVDHEIVRKTYYISGIVLLVLGSIISDGIGKIFTP